MSVETGRRYGIVHAQWMQHPELGADEIAVLAVLSTYADRQGQCGVGQQTIANRLRRSRSWTNRVIQTLAAQGILTVEHLRGDRGRMSGCRYYLTGHADICRRRVQDEATGTEQDTKKSAEVTWEQSGHRVVHRVAPAHTESPPDHSESSLLGASAPEGLLDFDNGEEKSEKTTQASWQPSAADMAYADKHRPDLDAEALAAVTKKLLAHHSEGKLTSVSSVWRRWVVAERAPRHSIQFHTATHRHPRCRQDDLNARNATKAQIALARLTTRMEAAHGCA